MSDPTTLEPRERLVAIRFEPPKWLRPKDGAEYLVRDMVLGLLLVWWDGEEQEWRACDSFCGGMDNEKRWDWIAPVSELHKILEHENQDY